MKHKHNIYPIVTYTDSFFNKSKILKDNKNKSGIYRWVNKITGESYVGRSKNLGIRFLKYYNRNHLLKTLLTKNSNIFKALLFYGHETFTLEILEYCDKKFTREREQYYIDLLKPEYNIRGIKNSNIKIG